MLRLEAAGGAAGLGQVGAGAPAPHEVLPPGALFPAAAAGRGRIRTRVGLLQRGVAPASRRGPRRPSPDPAGVPAPWEEDRPAPWWPCRSEDRVPLVVRVAALWD